MIALQAIGDTAFDASRRARRVRGERLAMAVGCVGLVVAGLALAQLFRVAPIQEAAAALHTSPVIEALETGTRAPRSMAAESAVANAAVLAQIGREIDCLALNIYFEARSESDAGKRAVGHVVMNRVGDPRFPQDICAVVQQGGEWPLHRCQFSWWCDGQSDEPKDVAAWSLSRTIAQQVYWGYSKDPTRGALWYHADYVAPSWGQILAQSAKIGRHIFYLDGGADRDVGKVQIATAEKMITVENDGL